MSRLSKVTLLMALASTSLALGQIKKSIVITNNNNQLVKNAVVIVNNQQLITDGEGKVQFDLKPASSYVIQVFAERYQSVNQTFDTVDLIRNSFVLEEDHTILSDIIVQTKDEQQNVIEILLEQSL